MSPIFFWLGVFGFMGLSVLCPIVAYMTRRLQRTFRRKTKRLEPAFFIPPGNIEIILPVHDESELIGKTIASIQQSIDSLKIPGGSYPPPTIRLHVGADGCTDMTVQIARSFAGVDVTEFQENRGKWSTIKTLFQRSSADWFILVDAGTLWEESFLSDVVGAIALDRNVIAVAPAYRPLKEGRIQRMLWHLETWLKRCETLCGGPVSLHGATVGYKAAVVKTALARLGETRWLNDDVVIPLTLRTLFPEGRILYPVGEVWDAGVGNKTPDLPRRRRMLMGNLQWSMLLLPDYFRRNPVAGVLALRRVFRIFWAYWILFAAVGIALSAHPLALPAFLSAGVLLGISESGRRFAGAGMVSLLAPLQMIRPGRLPQGSWK